jgi:hypothetical protein
MRPAARWSVPWPVSLAAALVLATASPAGCADELEALRRVNEQLRRERELAAGGEFYLRLDAEHARLALMLGGVVLDDYAVAALERGVPEVLFVDRRPATGWDLVALSGGRLEPERERDRIEIQAPPVVEGASPPPPPVPIAAEDSYSVPSAYRIVFAGGVSLEVRSKGAGGRNRSALRRIIDFVALRGADLRTALGLGPRETVRLRVTLDPDDAAALYRSLPPDVRFLAVGLPAR